MLMSMPVPVSPGLFLACHGDIKQRGRGLIGLVCEKRPQNINAWNWVGVALRCQGKTGRGSGQRWEMGATPSSMSQGKSFLQETSVMPGQMTTHVYGQDSTHVYGQV